MLLVDCVAATDQSLLVAIQAALAYYFRLSLPRDTKRPAHLPVPALSLPAAYTRSCPEHL